MSKGNAFLNRLARQQEEDDKLTRLITQQWTFDMVTIALGRLGWARSEVRMAQLDAMMTEVTREYSALAEDELRAEKKCKNPEFIYMKTKLDEELKAIVGNLFKPYEQRYSFDKK